MGPSNATGGWFALLRVLNRRKPVSLVHITGKGLQRRVASSTSLGK